MTKIKKRNPQDSTLRNIRALKKRVDKIDKSLKAHREAVNMLTDAISSVCSLAGIGVSLRKFK